MAGQQQSPRATRSRHGQSRGEKQRQMNGRNVSFYLADATHVAGRHVMLIEAHRRAKYDGVKRQRAGAGIANTQSRTCLAILDAVQKHFDFDSLLSALLFALFSAVLSAMCGSGAGNRPSPHQQKIRIDEIYSGENWL